VPPRPVSAVQTSSEPANLTFVNNEDVEISTEVSTAVDLVMSSAAVKVVDSAQATDEGVMSQDLNTALSCDGIDIGDADRILAVDEGVSQQGVSGDVDIGEVSTGVAVSSSVTCGKITSKDVCSAVDLERVANLSAVNE